MNLFCDICSQPCGSASLNLDEKGFAMCPKCDEWAYFWDDGDMPERLSLQAEQGGFTSNEQYQAWKAGR